MIMTINYDGMIMMYDMMITKRHSGFPNVTDDQSILNPFQHFAGDKS